MQNGIDVSKLDKIAGLSLTDAEFIDWVQSPGNLEPLCSVHHRTQLGIHHIPEPDWNAVRAWKDGIPEPVEYVTGTPTKLLGVLQNNKLLAFVKRWNTNLARL
jgi:hypothetical protein